MEILFYILVILGCLASIANTIILFFLVGFIVNLRDKLKEFFSDLVQMMAGFEPSAPVIVTNSQEKTWDQKFEEELAERERRVRQDSGLSDLPPPKASYGEPPAAKAQEGLIIRSQEGKMR